MDYGFYLNVLHIRAIQSEHIFITKLNCDVCSIFSLLQLLHYILIVIGKPYRKNDVIKLKEPLPSPTHSTLCLIPILINFDF